LVRRKGSCVSLRPGNDFPGEIHPAVLYRIDALQAQMGWSESAYYAAKRNGLKTHHKGKRTYALGSEVIAYVTSEVTE
jgi:hypothetical protein